MAEYFGYPGRFASGPLLKRSRTELDDGLLHGSAGYGHGGGGLRSDERDARLLDYGLDYGQVGAAYGSVGLTGADIAGLGDGSLLGAGNLRASNLGLSGLDDPRLPPVDSGLPKGSTVGLNGARSDILFRPDVSGARAGFIPFPSDPSSTLFVKGLPADCTRREASRILSCQAFLNCILVIASKFLKVVNFIYCVDIFRPFHGFKEIRVVQKGSKRPRVTLGFAEFEDAYAAAKALEALQGYKLDEDDHDSEPLQLQFARKCGPRVAGPDTPKGYLQLCLSRI